MSTLPNFSCSCLNVKIRVDKNQQGKTEWRSPVQDFLMQEPLREWDMDRVRSSDLECSEFRVNRTQSHMLRDPFLANGNCQRVELLWKEEEEWMEPVVSVRVPALLSQRTVAPSSEEETGASWVIYRCLICDMDVWGSELDSVFLLNHQDTKILRFKSGSQLLVGHNLLKAEDVRKAMESKDYSPATELAWPKNREPLGALTLVTEETEMSKRASTNSSSSSMDQEDAVGFSGKMAQSEAAQQIMAACAEYLRREQETMDIRVRSFIEKEAGEFEAKRKKAKADRDLMLRELESKTVTLSDMVGVGRQNSGGSANDSAVPLSPVSLASLEQSPGAMMNGLTGPLSPNTFKNPGMMGQPEESGEKQTGEEDLFSFDEDQVLGYSDTAPTTPAYLPADDEAETDDSGTGEDYSKYYPPYSEKKEAPAKVNNTTSTHSGERRDNRTAAVNTGLIFGGGKPTKGVGPLAFGTSMPVKIPNKFWPPKDAEDSMRPSEASSSDEENDEFLLHRAVVNKRRGTTGSGCGGGAVAGRRPHDMAASMRALAASVQAADDPERLFGEYPQRRRYKTGDAVRMRVAAGNTPAHHPRTQIFPDVVGQ